MRMPNARPAFAPPDIPLDGVGVAVADVAATALADNVDEAARSWFPCELWEADDGAAVELSSNEEDITVLVCLLALESDAFPWDLASLVVSESTDVCTGEPLVMTGPSVIKIAGPLKVLDAVT
jgi:hypothetical protein